MTVTQSTPTFRGTKDQKQLAEQVFLLARAQGRFFAESAPIGLKRDDLLAFLAAQRKTADDKRTALAALFDRAIEQNGEIFARTETDDGVVTILTTRAGIAPVAKQEDRAHTFQQRFLEPAAAPPPPPVPKKELTLIADGWARRPAPIDDGEAAIDEVIATQPQAAATDTAVETTAPAEPAPLSVVAEPVAAVEPAPSVTDEPGHLIPSLSDVPDDELLAALARRLEADDRFVAFGEQYFSEDLVDRYSRGDLRRIREYILELNEPLSDDTLLQELFNRRSNDPNYEAARFSINYRLSRERREFEYVGTRDLHLWSTSGLAPIGTTLRKASELGADYRYLLDAPAEEVGDTVEHTLTFFEWTYGVLPLDSHFRAFFPDHYLEDQKTAVLRFDIPQLYATLLVELRYPTSNRGGYIVGFEELFREQLTPGSIVQIERSAVNDGQFVFRYTAVDSPREERVLQLDERRNRYVFRPLPVQTEVDETWLIAEQRYPRLNNLRPLDERERRRPEQVLGVTFERVAEDLGARGKPRYWSTPDDLLPVANLERPFDLRTIQELLESAQFPQFVADPDTPGAFFYEPPAKEAAAAPAKRRKSRRGDDEELDFDLDEIDDNEA